MHGHVLNLVKQKRARDLCENLNFGDTIYFVGIDISDKMTEINVTSPTGIQEINRLMGVQLEVLLTDQIERLFASRA